MTGKELAKILGISETAVSMALNNKPGVSTQTRHRVKEAAEKYGMDLSKFAALPTLNSIYLVYYRRHGAVLVDSTFFSELTEGVEHACASAGYRIYTVNVHEQEDLRRQIDEISFKDAVGIILLGTEMRDDDFNILAFSRIPVILLDNHFISSKVDSVRINNVDGAFLATNYLINKRKSQPGYLHNSFYIRNFSERHEGYEKALRYNGMSPTQSVIHKLTPSIEGAYNEMREYLEKGGPIADCYFADNDLIAIGVLRALREAGYLVPKDVAVIGFDDITMCNYTDPPLTTVHIPKQYMGYMAVERLLSTLGKKDFYPVDISISAHLVVRRSV